MYTLVELLVLSCGYLKREIKRRGYSGQRTRGKTKGSKEKEKNARMGFFSEEWSIQCCFYCCFFSSTYSLIRFADPAGRTDIRTSSTNWGVSWVSKIETFGCFFILTFFACFYSFALSIVDECRSVNDVTVNFNLVVLQNELNLGNKNNLVDIDYEFCDRILQRI